jgi:hypothetical protein
MRFESDVVQLVTYCREHLALSEVRLPEEYRYAGVAHCVLDAVFSIGVRYEATRAVVVRYCEARGIERLRPSQSLPPISAQETLSAFVEFVELIGSDEFANRIVHNQQRTSTRSGILKAEAALRFSKVLRAFSVEYLQDLKAHANDNSMDRELRSITGFSSGVAIQYFWMLTGSEELVKPDRMVLRFLATALSRPSLLSTSEAVALVSAAAQLLRTDFPGLTARLLDYAIWEHQRNT